MYTNIVYVGCAICTPNLTFGSESIALKSFMVDDFSFVL